MDIYIYGSEGESASLSRSLLSHTLLDLYVCTQKSR